MSRKNRIDAVRLREMFASGANAVANEFAYIDELNVFPIPDGDTGTNMKLSLSGALPAVIDQDSAGGAAKQFARGLLMNARGNSGVIFSQVANGFAKALDGKKEIDTPELAVAAFESATVYAYKSVMAPVEGTMLTVIRMTAEGLRAKAKDLKDVEDVFAASVKLAKDALEKTPTMLQQLKEAGVVDSGGYGLWRFLEGMQLALAGKPVPAKEIIHTPSAKAGVAVAAAAGDGGELGYGYCCEFIVMIPKEEMASFKEKEFDQTIARLGESTVTVRDEDVVKVHTHTMDPGKLLAGAQKYGEFSQIKIDNMSLQAEHHVIFKKMAKKEPSVAKAVRKRRIRATGASLIVTVPTKEIGELMVKEYGAAGFIDRSLHGNPSTTTFIDAIKETRHRNVIVVTDDGNIVLAAESAAKECKEQDIRAVKVLPGKTIIQAMAAALAFDPSPSRKL